MKMIKNKNENKENKEIKDIKDKLKTIKEDLTIFKSKKNYKIKNNMKVKKNESVQTIKKVEKIENIEKTEKIIKDRQKINSENKNKKFNKNIKFIQKNKNLDKMYVIPLGGLEEVGKNTTVFQYKDEIIMVDSGALFPDENLPGIDLVIADYSFLENNKEKIKGIFITHGHEDHIGGLPYLYEKIDINTPIYGGKLTNALIRSKFDKFNRSKVLPPIKETTSRSVVKVGKYFTVEFVKVTHSIADSYALSIKTPAGHVFHTGDFKIDLTPVDGEKVDFVRLSELGEEGVDLMLSDSTNSEVDGFTPSEKTVGDAFRLEFAKANGRIIVASFASHVHRLQQIIDIAVECKRKIAIDGRSLVKIFEIAPTVGRLTIPNNLLVPISKISKFPDNEVLIVCTGTQGEPFAALSRIAKNMHKYIKLREKDTVIISSTPIPGNEKAVSNNINNLLRCEAEVVFKKITGIHVSGHGSKEEQKLMLNLINPKFFMPVHGEYRMLKAHMKSAIETGVPKENVLITQNGDKIEVTKESSKISGKVNSGVVLIDGIGMGGIGSRVIKDRQQLSQDGIVIVAYTIDKKTGKIISGPEISTKGFVYYKDLGEIINDATSLLKRKVNDNNLYFGKDWGDLKNDLRDILSKFFYEKFKRNPIILPMILEV